MLVAKMFADTDDLQSWPSVMEFTESEYVYLKSALVQLTLNLHQSCWL